MTLLPYRIRWQPGLAVLILGAILASGCASSNNSPVISSLTAEREWVASSSSSEIKCIASDADGDSLSYAWSATGGDFFKSGPVITWVAPGTPGMYTLTAIVTDGRGGEAKGQLTLGVRDNHPPIIASLTATPRRVVVARTSVIECVVSDPDGDELTYRWESSGGNISGESARATWTAPNREGNYVIRAIVTDSMGSSVSKDLAVTVICDCGSN
ncbi:MAG: hypothetical protein ABIH70_01080 [Chloroflexota bacterium]